MPNFHVEKCKQNKSNCLPWVLGYRYLKKQNLKFMNYKWVWVNENLHLFFSFYFPHWLTKSKQTKNRIDIKQIIHCCHYFIKTTHVRYNLTPWKKTNDKFFVQENSRESFFGCKLFLLSIYVVMKILIL
jgi:hypothetical protein